MSMPLRESHYPQGHLHPIVLMYDIEHGNLSNTDALAGITRLFNSIDTSMNAEYLVGLAPKGP